LIRQIRALDRVHREHVVTFDPTQSSNNGLLEELSLVELRERLAMQKKAFEEHRIMKNKRIISQKQSKDEALRQRVANIAKIRAAAATANRSARERQKKKEKEEELARKRALDEEKLAVAAKIRKQKKQQDEEEERLREEERRIAQKRMFLGAAKSQIEATHFEQQLQGAEREARERQLQVQTESSVYEATQQKDQAVRNRYRRKLADQIKKRDMERLEEQNKAAAHRRHVVHQDKETRKMRVTHERKAYKTALTILNNNTPTIRYPPYK